MRRARPVEHFDDASLIGAFFHNLRVVLGPIPQEAPVKRFALLSLLFIVAACTSTQPVDMKEARRVVGTENGVRVDAEVFGDRLTPNMSIALKYDVTNQRGTSILIADILPEATYDPDTQMVTISIGTEIPGEQFLPRLIPIQSGEKKSFSTGVHVVIVANPTTPWQPRPNALRLKINFLGETQPFAELIAIPEKAVHNPQLAEALFPKWVEGNESVTTNALPMRWATARPDDNAPSVPTPRRRGRGSPLNP